MEICAENPLHELTVESLLANMCGMPAVSIIFSTFIVANLFHAFAALLWIAGLRRFSSPFSPLILFDLFRWALILPAIFMLFGLLGLLPPGFHLIRAELWSKQLSSGPPLLGWVAGGLLIGTLLIFVFQEMLPFLQILNQEELSHVPAGDRLRSALHSAKERYRAAGITSRQLTNLRVYGLRTRDKIAALQGLSASVLVVSEGLVEALDDEELVGVLAHELAHIHLGGNLRMLFIWIARGIQAFNPVSLVLFREMTEARETACDALAARVTGRPEVLARALLKFTDPPHREAGAPVSPEDSRLRAGLELQRRAEMHATQVRYEALAGEGADIRFRIWSWPLQAMTALVFGGLLWIVA